MGEAEQMREVCCELSFFSTSGRLPYSLPYERVAGEYSTRSGCHVSLCGTARHPTFLVVFALLGDERWVELSPFVVREGVGLKDITLEPCVKKEESKKERRVKKEGFGPTVFVQLWCNFDLGACFFFFLLLRRRGEREIEKARQEVNASS